MPRSILLQILAVSIACGCDAVIPPLPPDDSILDGPVYGLTTDQNARFLAGDIAFNDEIFTPETGLGPVFVTTSCGTCHAGDGKGHPFSTLTRFGQTDSTGNKFIGRGGPQLQNRAIAGFVPELLPAGAAFAKFMPPANTGLGFLEALTDQQVMAYADPQDADGDGISGVPNLIDPPAYYIPGPSQISFSGKYIGRFGKKASAINLLHQTVNAYNQDIGITSVFDPVDPYTQQPTDPEVSEKTIRDVVFYLQTLKEPIQRNISDGSIIKGKQLFLDIGCGKCHVPEWTTPVSSIAALSEKTFYPYTDLLLHDMGPGLDDGYTEGTALTIEWRTPPLWGIGLAPNSQGGRYFLLHDGRAGSLEEAILMHGGEGDASRAAFEILSETDKEDLVRFLESL